MAAQNINLYREELAEKRSAGAQATSVAGLAGLGVFAIVGHVVWMGWQIQDQRMNLARLNQEISVLATNTAQFTARMLAAEGIGKEGDLAAMEARITQLQSRRNALEGYLKEHSPGFSAFLIALARQHVQGMWLTEIGVSNATRKVDLDGASTRPELVTEYLSRLSLEPELQGIQFRGFRLSEPEDVAQPGQVRFHVSTENLDGALP